MGSLVPLALLAILVAPSLAQVDWCQVQSQHCNGKRHIACGDTFPYGPTCQNVQIVPMTAELKTLILNGHNQYRQDVASGSNSRFPSAQKMSMMEWDDTLAYVAEQHAKHCNFAHDECRATPEYPLSGQNLAYRASTRGMDPATAIEASMASWNDEWRMAPSSVVDRISNANYSTYHWTVMMNDRNNKVGCAAITYTYPSGQWTMNAVMLSCNYQYTNVVSQPLYTKGTPCSQCQCSAQFPALCQAAGSGSGSGSGSVPVTTSTTPRTTTTTTTTRRPATGNPIALTCYQFE